MAPHAFGSEALVPSGVSRQLGRHEYSLAPVQGFTRDYNRHFPARRDPANPEPPNATRGGLFHGSGSRRAFRLPGPHRHQDDAQHKQRRLGSYENGGSVTEFQKRLEIYLDDDLRTMTSAKRIGALAQVGPGLQRLMRPHFNRRAIRIAIVPLGETLNGTAVAGSRTEYKIIIMSGAPDTLKPVVPEPYKSIILQHLDDLLDQQQQIRFQLSNVERGEIYNLSGLTSGNVSLDNFDPTLWLYLFFPTAYGDRLLLEEARREVLRQVTPQAWANAQDFYRSHFKGDVPLRLPSLSAMKRTYYAPPAPEWHRLLLAPLNEKLWGHENGHSPFRASVPELASDTIDSQIAMAARQGVSIAGRTILVMGLGQSLFELQQFFDKAPKAASIIGVEIHSSRLIMIARLILELNSPMKKKVRFYHADPRGPMDHLADGSVTLIDAIGLTVPVGVSGLVQEIIRILEPGGIAHAEFELPRMLGQLEDVNMAMLLLDQAGTIHSIYRHPPYLNFTFQKNGRQLAAAS